MRLPIDAHVRPTAEQMDRAKVADELFRLHADINVIISAAVIRIMDGGPIEQTTKAVVLAVVTATNDTAERLKR